MFENVWSSSVLTKFSNPKIPNSLIFLLYTSDILNLFIPTVKKFFEYENQDQPVFHAALQYSKNVMRYLHRNISRGVAK